MEKYTDWRDPFTGISPFLPPSFSLSLVGLVLGLLRLPLVAVLLSLTLLCDAALPVLRPVWSWVLVRPLLLSLGAFLSFPPSRSTAAIRGDLVFVNHKSWVDLLCLAAVAAPRHYCHVFGGRMVLHSSLAGALVWMVRRSSPADATVPLERLRELRGPVAVFVEGVTSNHEKCLLKLDDDVARAIDALGVPHYSFALISYASPRFAYLRLSESFAAHLWGVLSAGVMQRVSVFRLASDAAGFEAGFEKLSLVTGHKRLKRLGWREKETFKALYLQKQ